MNTIVSISTAPGVGGIGIIRMSGNNCFDILEKIFKAKKQEKIENIKGYTMKYGHIYEGNQIVDEVIVSYFKNPKSYTAENMCEINSHGGNIIVKKILELCLKNGADLAEPGEFTKRAFLNGRIDLLQAESVIDIINSKSEREAKAGIKQLEGFLSKEINGIKAEILEVMTNVEVAIDYPEYDVEEVSYAQILSMLDKVKTMLNKLEKSFDDGKLIKDGIKTAIIGKPNAGKSSLLNAVLKEERAIVTDIAGTTRDTIEEFVNINGIPIKLIDTAGIRQTDDTVEKIGVAKSREIAKDADLIIVIIDANQGLKQEDIEILEIAKNKKAIIILNKIDLEIKVDENSEELKVFEKSIIKMSMINKKGLEELYDKITELFHLNEINLDSEIVVTNIRHKNLISNAILSVKKTEETIIEKMPLDIIAIFIKEILENLGNITGEVVSEEIIDQIFARFCLGK